MLKPIRAVLDAWDRNWEAYHVKRAKLDYPPAFGREWIDREYHKLEASVHRERLRDRARYAQLREQ